MVKIGKYYRLARNGDFYVVSALFKSKNSTTRKWEEHALYINLQNGEMYSRSVTDFEERFIEEKMPEGGQIPEEIIAKGGGFKNTFKVALEAMLDLPQVPPPPLHVSILKEGDEWIAKHNILSGSVVLYRKGGKYTCSKEGVLPSITGEGYYWANIPLLENFHSVIDLI